MLATAPSAAVCAAAAFTIAVEALVETRPTLVCKETTLVEVAVAIAAIEPAEDSMLVALVFNEVVLNTVFEAIVATEPIEVLALDTAVEAALAVVFATIAADDPAEAIEFAIIAVEFAVAATAPADDAAEEPTDAALAATEETKLPAKISVAAYVGLTALKSAICFDLINDMS